MMISSKSMDIKFVTKNKPLDTYTFALFRFYQKIILAVEEYEFTESLRHYLQL